VLSINVYLESQALGRFSIGYGLIGPTEVRIALIALNTGLALGLDLATGVDQDHEVPVLPRDVLHAGEHAPRERRGGDLIRHEADRPGSAGSQSPRERIRRVTDLLGRTPNSLLRCDGDAGVAAVQDERHGCRGDTRGGGDIRDPDPCAHRAPPLRCAKSIE
jgi:hypothetical protein